MDELKKNEWYFKPVKSTGLARGVCNEAKMSCHWNDKDRRRYDLQGNEFIARPEVTEEFVILDQAGDYTHALSNQVILDLLWWTGLVVSMAFIQYHVYIRRPRNDDTTYSGNDQVEDAENLWCLGCIQVTNISIKPISPPDSNDVL